MLGLLRLTSQFIKTLKWWWLPEGPVWVDGGPSFIVRKSAAVGGKATFARAKASGEDAPIIPAPDSTFEMTPGRKAAFVLPLARLRRQPQDRARNQEG
jgi:hypothetical protein